jgi:hypothetical protein
MDPVASSGSGRVPLQRGLIALAVFAVLLVGTVGYHDGAFGTEDVAASDLSEGTYRFKGTVESYDEEGESFSLRDASGARDFQWNVTTPKIGEVYVVDADVGAEGGYAALALTRVYLVRGSWT